MKYLILTLAILLGACSTTVPVTAKFPEAPGILAQQPCPALEKLVNDPKLSQVATTVSNNYTEYYACAFRVEAWQRWYREQKIIYEGFK
jgi:hypothetical protein